MSDRLTVVEKLLVAALCIREEGAKSFSAEDLVISAWRMFPDTFGLAGYATEYPDSNRVLTKIMGTEGMRGKGWLRKVGEKQYRLTTKALDEGRSLLEKEVGDHAARRGYLRAQLNRETVNQLSRIMTTVAARKALEGKADAVTFNEACGFWDISARSNANTLNVRLAELSALLARAKQALDQPMDADGFAIQSGKLNLKQIEIIGRLHSDLQERYSSELRIIRSRKDERIRRMRRRV